jgi:hypothetical protein
VRGEAVELDDQAHALPHEVDLEPLDPDVAVRLLDAPALDEG